MARNETKGFRSHDLTKLATCASCGGARHPRSSKLAEDFNCYWRQFSHNVVHLPVGEPAPFRKRYVLQFADWVEGNAKPRPTRGTNGDDIPPHPDARVVDFE